MKVHSELSAEALAEYFDTVVGELEEEVRYYRVHRKRGRWKTTILRSLAVVAAAAGILLPLLGQLAGRIAQAIASWIGIEQADITGIEAGYVALAVGAVLLLVDQVFTFSSGWVRYMVTELKLRKELSELQFEWAERFPRVVAGQGGSDEASAALAVLRKARLAGHRIVEAETKTWASELERAKAALSDRIDRQG